MNQSRLKLFLTLNQLRKCDNYHSQVMYLVSQIGWKTGATGKV